MASSTIPNLSTFRKGPSRGRSRGGDFAVDGARGSKDEIVQHTDNDAAGSRISAVEAGYLDDPFARLITNAPRQRRLPLMNRGTYVRTVGIDRIVDVFIVSQQGRKQIISLGAGSDTRYFRLVRKWATLDLVYHEIDFEANTKTKIDRIRDVEFAMLAQKLCSIDVGRFQVSGGDLRSPHYCIHAQDLRALPGRLDQVDLDLPTLVISECCLIYLSPGEAENVLKDFSLRFSAAPLAIAIYEPIRPDDAFGKTMVKNLISRGIHLQTLEKYAELPHQRQRLLDLGLMARAEDIDFIWNTWVEDDEKERVNSLEWMDEVEEFVLLAKHYCISWGWKGWLDDSKWRNLAASKIAQH